MAVVEYAGHGTYAESLARRLLIWPVLGATGVLDASATVYTAKVDRLAQAFAELAAVVEFNAGSSLLRLFSSKNVGRNRLACTV